MRALNKKKCSSKMNTDIWNIIENIIFGIYEKFFHKKVSAQDRSKVMQFLRFAAVGASNSLISYVIYALLIKLNIHYVLSNIIGFSISVFNAHYWNNKYVFVEDKELRNWWQTFIKTYLSYAMSGIVVSNILITIWIEVFNFPSLLAPIMNLIVTLPINFIFNKYWAYRSKNKTGRK